MSRVHFIGVGGSGMSAVARLTASRGHTVSGSDQRESHYFLALRHAGMDVRIGHDPAVIDGVDTVVVSSAVRESNPELAAARARGIEVIHRSEALARALDNQRLIAVAGSHGKTTTSAMVATVLHGSGIDAGFAVGARVFGVEGAVAGGYAGTAGVAAVEADESDGSFLRYHPEVAILLNVEPDHLDHYGTLDALHEAFAEFASDCRVLIACADDPVVMTIAHRAADAGVRVVTYGAGEADVQVTPEALIVSPPVVQGQTSRAAHGSAQRSVLPLEVPVPGAHMRLNAAAAWTAAVVMGADPDDAARAVARFEGTGRRYERRGEVGGVTVVDDYAHHPTEVAALLAAARSQGAHRLVVLFQPALFSRTQLHAAAFGRALSIPDADVVIAGVHGDREDPIAGVSSSLIQEAVEPRDGLTVRVVEDLHEAAAHAAQLARPGDLVLTVGSGPVTYAGQWILDAVAARL